MADEPIEVLLLRQKLEARAARVAAAARKLELQAARQAAADKRLALKEAELRYKEEKLRASVLARRSAKDKADDELYRKTQEHLKRVAEGRLTSEEILARNAELAAEQLRRRKEAQEKRHAEWLAAQTPEDIERARRREGGNP